MRLSLPMLFSLLLVCSPAAAEPVVSCGQTVTDGELAADLDCADTTGFAVIIEVGGSLDLAGYDIVSGNAPQWNSGGAIFCEGDCDVRGGGGSIRSAVAPDHGTSTSNVPIGVLIPHPRRGRISISDLTITNYAFGVNARRLRVRSVTATDNGVAIVGKRLRVSKSSFTSNDQGASATRILLRNSEVADNGNGMTTRHAVVRRSTITGHQIWGVFASDGLAEGTLTASDSTINGNCLADGYSDGCHDFSTSSPTPPELDNVTCSHSGHFDVPTQTWGTWNVCSED